MTDGKEPASPCQSDVEKLANLFVDEVVVPNAKRFGYDIDLQIYVTGASYLAYVEGYKAALSKLDDWDKRAIAAIEEGNELAKSLPKANSEQDEEAVWTKALNDAFAIWESKNNEGSFPLLVTNHLRANYFLTPKTTT